MNNHNRNGDGNIISVSGISLSYGTQKVLENVDLLVAPGQIVGLLGPNGCGKTSLIKILAGLRKDYTGEARVCGFEPGEESKALVSYLPEKTYLANWMRISDALRMFSDFYTDFDAAMAEDLLARLSLKKEMRIRTMSKGMQEKLQITLVMCRRARLYLLDEPLGGIDPASRGMILDIILQNYREESSILLATHLVHDVERVFDSVIMLGYGGVVMSDSADNIRQKTGKTIDDVFREVFRC